MVTGTGTLFATDSQRAVCPAGVPGPPGLVVYSTGTLTMSAGFAVVTGSGTAWNMGNGVVAGNMIRIAATHGGGTAFVTWAVINSVDSVTQLTLSRPAPSDIDGTGFSYKITGPLYGSFEVPIPGTPSVTNIIQNILACESETRLSTSSYFEADAFVALGPDRSEVIDGNTLLVGDHLVRLRVSRPLPSAPPAKPPPMQAEIAASWQRMPWPHWCGAPPWIAFLMAVVRPTARWLTVGPPG